ncbi:MAG: cell division protein CrgA [Acidimicrobiales bacterium]
MLKGGATSAVAGPSGGGRYTPPIPKEFKVSPRWVPILMGILLGLGMIVIVFNYLGLVPGGEASNWYLLAGLGLITGGFVVATRWH